MISSSQREVSHHLTLPECSCRWPTRGRGRASRDLPRQRRRMIVSEFTIRRFFEKFPRSLLSARPWADADSAPINNYLLDFDNTSKRVREQRGWRCECCQRDFSQTGNRRYLHVHHKNGIKNENFEGNLQVLCLGCHANQPQHAHLKKFPEYREFLRRFGRY